jgi:hypothetical protein
MQLDFEWQTTSLTLALSGPGTDQGRDCAVHDPVVAEVAVAAATTGTATGPMTAAETTDRLRRRTPR